MNIKTKVTLYVLSALCLYAILEFMVVHSANAGDAGQYLFLCDQEECAYAAKINQFPSASDNRDMCKIIEALINDGKPREIASCVDRMGFEQALRRDK